MLGIGRSLQGSLARFSRRNLLELGTLAPLGVSLATLSDVYSARGGEKPAVGYGRARRCLIVYLNGGPSQLDLWDMKPDAPSDIRGELVSIPTVVPGLRLSELLPLTSQQADKFKIVRSVTHAASVHTTALYTMLTGTHHVTPTVDQLRATPQDHPHLGSIVAKYLGWRDRLPPFVCLPSLFQAPPVDGIWPGQNAGFLGQRYDPLVIQGEKLSARYALKSLELPAEIPPPRLTARRELVANLSRSFDRAMTAREIVAHTQVTTQAYDLVGASRLAQAADLEQESATNRDRYGRHLFGQGVLLARRLIEAGLPLVTVYWNDPTPAGEGGGEYDSHGRIYWHMRNRLVPPTDRALAALFADLDERGLLADTLVVVMGEFGRTPRINAQAGRDHWPQVQSILLAGAGVSGGTLYGASDKHGAFPALDPVTPPDLGQTLLHALGIPATFEITDQQGRAFAASPGDVVPGLLA